jgi:hypothetical protein
VFTYKFYAVKWQRKRRAKEGGQLSDCPKLFIFFVADVATKASNRTGT